MIFFQLGTALTFFIPPTLVKDGPPDIIGDGLRKMQWYNAGISTSILLLIILCNESSHHNSQVQLQLSAMKVMKLTLSSFQIKA